MRLRKNGACDTWLGEVQGKALAMESKGPWFWGYKGAGRREEGNMHIRRSLDHPYSYLRAAIGGSRFGNRF